MPLDDRPASSAEQDRQLKLSSSLFATRRFSLDIAEPLSAEDQVVQANEDASPTKWHLAHTTWFFEELVLKRFLRGYSIFDERFSYCFNSYYESLGARHPRPKRGLLTRPSVEEVRAYRAHVDENLRRLMAQPLPEEALSLIETGINHEQQHQELMLTDILALFAENPLRPAYCDAQPGDKRRRRAAGHWRSIPGGIYEIGHRGAASPTTMKARRIRFCFAISAFSAARSRMANGSPSWRRAAIGRHRCGCRMAGPRCSAKAGKRPAIGSFATAPGIR